MACLKGALSRAVCAGILLLFLQPHLMQGWLVGKVLFRVRRHPLGVSVFAKRTAPRRAGEEGRGLPCFPAPVDSWWCCCMSPAGKFQTRFPSQGFLTACSPQCKQHAQQTPALAARQLPPPPAAPVAPTAAACRAMRRGAVVARRSSCLLLQLPRCRWLSSRRCCWLVQPRLLSSCRRLLMRCVLFAGCC